MSSIIANTNLKNGLVLQGITMPVVVSDSKFINNLNGVLMEKTSSKITLVGCEGIDQRENGISGLEFDGWMSLKGVKIHNSAKHGFYYLKSHTCAGDSVASRFAAHLQVESSTFDSNSETGLHMSSNCRVNVTISTSNFTNNTLANYIQHNSESYTAVVHLIRIQDNVYSVNKRAVSIIGGSSLEMLIQGNQFTENLGYALKVNTGSSHRFGRRSVYTVTKNMFSSNDAKFDSLISIIVLSNAQYQNTRDIDFVENSLYGNTYTRPERYFVHNRYSQQAILHIHTETSMEVHHNIMDNPEAEIQLYAADKNPKLIQQAHHCYWGTTDVNVIFNKVYGYHKAVGYSRVNLFPILNSKDFKDFNPDLLARPEFVQGRLIGGHVFGNLELKDTANPYIVDKDIIIERGQTLSISPGVTLVFEVGKSVYVQGKLNIEGTQENPVALRLHRDESQYPARIQQDNQQLDGIMQVKIENKWYSICSEDIQSSIPFDFFCQIAGYEKSIKTSRVLDKNEAATSIGKLQCPSESKHLGACTFEVNFNCTEGYVFQVQCAPSHWSGIHFTYDADKSMLKHVQLDHTGYPNGHQGQTAIQSDIHRHLFEHITLTNMRDDSSTVGIKTLKVDVVNNYPISEISMTDFKLRGSGVISYDARLSILNTSIQNNRSVNENGIYIKSSMVKIPSLLHDDVPSICFNTSYNLLEDDLLFLRVKDTDIARNSKCELLITTDPGRKIGVQVISGNVGTAQNCGIQTLLFHDGHKNDSDPTGVKVDADGHLWTSTVNQAHIIMHRVYHYRYECMNIVIQISSVRGKNVLIDTGHILGNQNIIINNSLLAFPSVFHFKQK